MSTPSPVAPACPRCLRLLRPSPGDAVPHCPGCGGYESRPLAALPADDALTVLAREGIETGGPLGKAA